MTDVDLRVDFDVDLRVDLSADLGELAAGEDEVWPLITSANVACGGHVGDAATMTDAVRRAKRLGVRLGAHPSFPDRANFGRKSLAISMVALRDSLIEQITALAEIAAREGLALVHVKPHGALYNDAHRDLPLARLVVEAMQAVDDDLALVCSDSSQMAVAAREVGLRVIREAFADRRYEPDGALTPRSIAGSTLSVDEAAAQAQLLVDEGLVVARDGSRFALSFDTLCVHADLAGAADRLRAIRARLR